MENRHAPDSLDSIDSIDSLRARHQQLAAQEPRLRIRERALRLGVPEAALVAAGCGVHARPLAGTAQALFRELGTLGPLMALSRNDAAVHERHGRYLDIQADGPVGLVLGPDIDLRLFFNSWKHFYAVSENGRHSLQFFDRSGEAVHKVYRTEHTDGAAWDAYVERFATEAGLPVVAEPPGAPEQAEAPDDAGALRSHWLGLTDTHDFFAMLRHFKVSRLGALRAAGADLAQPVAGDAVEAMLGAAAASGLPIMCFVANRGIVQIHTGPVKRLLRTGPWFNVLDDTFNLHLNTEAVASSWVVNKPTSDGWVTSLELYGADGELIVQFFGERKPGKPELPAWRSLMASLCAQPLAA
ncbi:hemin-degrading factor [Cupriavidus sp. USMAA2-4]|uniref:hemin-degrading factor n=1 Tax=Cupriavidus sp. USMAA2-4 TaxID=876364 RepID=UPI0008A6F3FF|nr:ChuX/HutX family heme-like substrate-binding protein [Cupriavidus sp. USMAA2-4]AOY91948.1 hemin-degrading factor [Cupriavidus sp. USMAA2-4]